jgi:hypothetical protein
MTEQQPPAPSDGPAHHPGGPPVPLSGQPQVQRPGSPQQGQPYYSDPFDPYTAPQPYGGQTPQTGHSQEQQYAEQTQFHQTGHSSRTAGPPDSQLAAPADPERSRLKVAVFITCAVLAVLLITGVTTVLVLNHRADVAAAERKAEEKRLAADKAKDEAEEKAAELAAARATYKTCSDQLNPLVTALSNIDARLDVGLSQGELSNMLGRASIAYNRIDIESLGQGNCLTAGARLETAFNRYNSTVSTWEDCIYDYSCDVDRDILPGMQQKWSKASGLIDQSETLLATLDPDSATYDASAFGKSGDSA